MKTDDDAPVAARRDAFIGWPLLLAASLLGGCAGLGPKPWDHDLLARPEMALNTHPNITAYSEHIYFSKEASAGGRTFDGGGCGCN
jgi:Domain of unknown function (DUF4266)